MVSRLLAVACYITVHKMSLTTRLAAIDSVGGDTGVKPEHVTSLCPPRTVPHHHFVIFFNSNKII